MAFLRPVHLHERRRLLALAFRVVSARARGVALLPGALVGEGRAFHARGALDEADLVRLQVPVQWPRGRLTLAPRVGPRATGIFAGAGRSAANGRAAGARLGEAVGLVVVEVLLRVREVERTERADAALVVRCSGHGAHAVLSLPRSSTRGARAGACPGAAQSAAVRATHTVAAAAAGTRSTRGGRPARPTEEFCAGRAREKRQHRPSDPVRARMTCAYTRAIAGRGQRCSTHENPIINFVIGSIGRLRSRWRQFM